MNKIFSKISPMQFNAIFVILLIGTLRLLGFGRDVLVADYFGLNVNVDIYILSLVIPMFFLNVFNTSLMSFFTPFYVKMKSEEGPSTAKDYTTSLFVFFMIIFLVLSVVIMYLLPQVVVHFNKALLIDTGKQDMFYSLSRWGGALLFLSIPCSFLSVLFQAEHRYGYSFSVQFIIPVVTIMVILFTHEHGVSSIIQGMTIGTLISAALSFFIAFIYKLIGFFPAKFLYQKIKNESEQFGFLILASLINTCVPVVDQYMASKFGTGALATFSYAVRIPNALCDIFAMGLAVGVFSYFSEWMARSEREKIGAVIGKVILYVSLLVIPICVILMFFAQPLIHVMFERGAFSIKDTFAVSRVFQAYTPVLYFSILNMVLGRCISAARKNEFFIVMDIFYLMLRVLFNVLFIKMFGLIGIPISGVFVGAVFFVVSYLYIYKEKTVLG